ncbi:hypothetical protein BT67DRAFT_144234 [Trichocladium antarcticum]|uniref:Uncharacterized protein n=1 Tax=Trichocladium antarcticum TaxID=1450529 RepID=A0AAN6UF54_9PEZI|nr:hypothetical protein BT67DRAFT_144234 [Trichocladium antarcticum]
MCRVSPCVPEIRGSRVVAHHIKLVVLLERQPARRPLIGKKIACVQRATGGVWSFVTQSTCPVQRAGTGSPRQSGVGAAVPLRQSEHAPGTTPAITPSMHQVWVRGRWEVGCVPATKHTHLLSIQDSRAMDVSPPYPSHHPTPIATCSVHLGLKSRRFLCRLPTDQNARLQSALAAKPRAATG